jgi:NAD(P)-dependent dehydrogenase (short-subunit alcohol dehydrogenase family)
MNIHGKGADDRLSGKIAFLAGASMGINLGVARGFAQAGAKVAIISRSEERIEKAAQNLRDEGFEAIGIAADVRDYTAVDAAISAAADKWGEIDIVLSGAAGNFMAPAAALSANGFKTVVDIDLLGTFNVFRASYARLRRPGASLIAITAPQAFRPARNQAHACAAKAGINMLTKCLALEWGGEGIRVNGISPGPILETGGIDDRMFSSPEAKEEFRRSIPLDMYGEKWDIAELSIFLSTQSARFITGTIVDCDGGIGMTV